MTFLCRGMVWGVDWIHLVRVGVGIKKPRGVNLNVLYRRLMRIYSEYRISNIQTTLYWSRNNNNNNLLFIQTLLRTFPCHFELL